MDSVEFDKLANTIKSLNMDSNGWNQIEKFFRTEPRIQELFREVSCELARDQCFGLATHMVATIEKLLDFYEDAQRQ